MQNIFLAPFKDFREKKMLFQKYYMRYDLDHHNFGVWTIIISNSPVPANPGY